MTAPRDGDVVLRLLPERADLARLYPWLDAAAAGSMLGETLMARIHVAVEEAVSNVALHAGASFITVTLSIEPQAAQVDVEDDGAPFDPTQAVPSPRTDANAPPGGWGLGLMRRFCPDLSYTRSNAGNRLRLRFPL